MGLQTLIKKRAGHKSKLTQFDKFLEPLKECKTLGSLQISELNIRLTKMEELYTDYDDTQTEIENVSETSDEQFAEREKFEKQYFLSVAVAREMLAQHRPGGGAGSSSASGSGTARGGGQRLKLPTIQLPTFSGQYHDWLEFHDTFNALIHKESSIPTINKFHYLRAALKDSAALIIRSLDFSADNYIVAWDLLCDRFNNKRLLVNNHIQAIFNIETLPKESSKLIRNLIDTVNRNLRSLETLELPTQHWDALIIYIISSKLDPTTSREWETHRNSFKDLPTLENCINFLKGRADLLETMDDSQTKRRYSDVTHSRHKSLVVNSLPPLSKPYVCPLCKGDHAIYRCSKFRSFTLDNKISKAKFLKLCLNCLRQGHSTNYCKLSPCRVCNKPINSLLHIHKPPTATETTPNSNNNVVLCAAPPPPPSHTQPETQANSNVSKGQNDVALSAINKSCVLLSTALIQVEDCNGQKHTIRALLDNGSTSSFITENLCTKLNLQTASTSSLVEGLNFQTSQLTKRCDVTISSLLTSYGSKISCYVVPRITQLLPTTQVDYWSLNIPKYITLADPTFHCPSQVDMLLGADIFWSVLYPKNISLGTNKPTLSKTKFGWLISGLVQTNYDSNTVHCNHAILSFNDSQIDNKLERFFEFESVPHYKQISKEEQLCENNFIDNVTRESDGRFSVSIPLKESPHKLGDSYQQALVQFLTLERRFHKDPLFKKQYCDFIQEYISLGHMTENKNPIKDTHTYLLPHHGVLRSTSLTTKLRVVFDASAVTTSGLSFNNIQLVGPTVQDDLISILIRLRQHKFVATADVEKMYRMINVREEQRELQQILWRFEPHDVLKQYKLNTVTYGTASAPYLATRCLKQLGMECSDKQVSEVIQHDFYVDDLITGASSEEDLVHICKGVTKQLESAQFHLRKWHSNRNQLISKIIDTENNDDKFLNLSNNEYSKTLGLLWSCKEDMLLYTVNIKENPNITKRLILSVMSQVFDPLGLINPCVLMAKIMLQKLWASKITWDETVPAEIQTLWKKFTNSLLCLNNLRIPRYVLTYDYPSVIEIHAFSDASTQAYSACIYTKSITSSNKVCVHLVTAKSRVAPLKPATIPRLELCGALLAARLAEKVKQSFRLQIKTVTYWCDSTIVLGWIKSAKFHLLKPFVFNRIHEIHNLSEPTMWRHVPTSYNPADIGSRGSEAKLLQKCSLWWSGPSFLMQDESHWPVQPTNSKEVELPEFKIPVQCCLSIEQSDHFTYISEFIKRFSNICKLQRVIAYVQRFINNCSHPNNKYTGYLKVNELNSSLNSICNFAQRESFSEEYELLKKNKTLPTKNKLLNLTPFFDNNTNLMRVGGRLSNSYYDYDVKHPILLHSSHHVTTLLLSHYHTLSMHCGPQLLLSITRHKFWIIGGRNLARKTVHRCVKCCRFSGKTHQPIMGNLPKQRLYADFPFSNTAVDYAGPVMIVNRKGRGSRLIKAYLCIFVCLAVKAVHIELVTDLSSDTYLAALNRFIARRGKPANIFSDNGTNFVGACNELSKFIKQNSDYIASKSSELSIKFRFTPPYTPHFNGIAEGAVKSVKHHLKRVVSSANLTYEEMNTVLTQIESILNSRPLTPISSDPADFTALTPSHFLIGRTLMTLPSPRVENNVALHTLSRYMRMQTLKTHFWNRFYKEYITDLQKRQKWSSQGGQLKLGEMVLIKDDRLPPNQWLLGRVTSVHPGTDGVSRVADVLTTSGTLRRAFNRLCPLPAMEENLNPGAARC